MFNSNRLAEATMFEYVILCLLMVVVFLLLIVILYCITLSIISKIMTSKKKLSPTGKKDYEKIDKYCEVATIIYLILALSGSIAIIARYITLFKN